MSKLIKDQSQKPEDVSIVMITSTALPTQMGSVGVMILGLGSDDKVYNYVSDKQIWLIQK